MSNNDYFPDPDIFSNTIHKTFQFFIAKYNTFILIDELMSESVLSFVLPQMLMNTIMTEEMKLMNCITCWSGDVSPEWQRSQMRALESHLRLVNVLTESLNKLSHYQTQYHFRASITKKELFLQFIPINFHLQRCLVSDGHRKSVSDIFTVGAYCCHLLGFDSGGLKSDLFNCAQNNQHLGIDSVWRTLKEFLQISALRDQIEQYLNLLYQSIDSQSLDTHLILDYFNKIDNLCKEIVTVLSSKQVDNSLAFYEIIRSNQSLKVSSNLDIHYENIANSFEKSLSLEETSKSNFETTETTRRGSMANDQLLEFEPIELIHLNIKASLISMNAKLNNKNSLPTTRELDASKTKLRNAVESLYRTSSICYASEAIKLERNQIEFYYSVRLRRAMIFSQALTSIIIATISQLKSKSFIQRALETKCILAQHEVLLSCYANEIGMLEDMVFSIQQINSCVKFVFETSVISNYLPTIEGNSFNLRVVFPIPNLTANFECNVTAIIFNVGINENATLAETFGYVKFQELLNKENYHILESYINIFFKEDQVLLANMSALKAEIWSNRSKNVNIFTLSEKIVQRIEGLRFTSCKSAKDRTSMAVTLEETRICAKFFNISELHDSSLFQKIVDTLRRLNGIELYNSCEQIATSLLC